MLPAQPAQRFSVSNVKLDIPFNANTYAYYLDYTSASAQNGTMVITLPAGSAATINGTNYTNGEKVELDPKKDFLLPLQLKPKTNTL